MSNIPAKRVVNSLFQFGGIVVFPVLLAKFISQNIASTIRPQHKKKFKEIQKNAISKSVAIASSYSNYKTASGDVNKEVGPRNLQIFCKEIMNELINKGFTYDKEAMEDYEERMGKLPAFIKNNDKLIDKYSCKYHKEVLSLKKTLGTLKGSCQEYSTLVAIGLASQLETKGLNKIKQYPTVQDMLNQKECEFLGSLPSNRKVKIIFGNVYSLNGSQEDSLHCIVKLEYKDPQTDKQRSVIIDPATILYQKTVADRRANVDIFCFVPMDTYQKNIERYCGRKFVPITQSIELKGGRPMENLYRELYYSDKLNFESKNISFTK